MSTPQLKPKIKRIMDPISVILLIVIAGVGVLLIKAHKNILFYGLPVGPLYSFIAVVLMGGLIMPWAYLRITFFIAGSYPRLKNGPYWVALFFVILTLTAFAVIFFTVTQN